MEFNEIEGNGKPADGQPTPFHQELFASNRHRSLNLNDTVAVDAGTTNSTVVAPDTTSTQTCPQSDDYIKFLDLAARDMYDPASLGDLTSVEHEFDCDIHNTSDAIKYANKALSTTGDRFNQVLAPEQVRDLQKEMNPDYVGIGVSLVDDSSASQKGSSQHGVIIKSVMPGGPGAQAGLRSGDKIVGVGSNTFGDGSSSDAVIDALNGKVGDHFKVTVERDGKQQNFDVALKQIDVPTVKDFALGNGIGYIAISSFDDEKGPQKLAAALKRQSKEQALIVDVRGNPGGLVSNAVDMTAALLKSGTVITERSRKDSDPLHPQYTTQQVKLTTKNELDSTMTEGHPKSLQTVISSRFPYLAGNKPIVILVDGNTASASEIFTGALHDNHAATVIGTQTFGKGIGQTLFSNMPGGSELKVTSFRYFTPSGAWLGDADKHRIGITPDVVVADTRNPASDDDDSLAPQAPNPATDAQLAAAANYLQQQLAARQKSH